MKNEQQKKILLLAIYAAEIMMKSGAEIYRVEDTIMRICKATHIDNVEVFATPTGIFVSLDTNNYEDVPLTYIKRIQGSSTNLSKISEINAFSRKFTTTKLSVEEGMKILKKIDAKKPYSLPIRLLAAAFVSSSFTIMFGGNIVDFIAGFFTGIVAYLTATLLSKLSVNFFIRGFCSCAVTTFLALLISTLIAQASYEPIIIGTIMLFVPGVAITNSIRDFLSSDMLSGLARMAEAFLVAVSLAVGAGIVLKLWEVIGGCFI